MPKLLPPDPSLDQLQKQAKDLQKACRVGDRDALEWVKSLHPAYEESSLAEIPTSDCSLRDAQLVIAREYYFKDWARLKEYVLWDLPVKNQEIEKLRTMLEEKPSRAKQAVMSFRRDGSTWTSNPAEFANNNIPVLKLLLKYGATLKAAGLFRSNSTPEFIDFAIEQGGDIERMHYNGSVLLLTARQAHLDTLKYYIMKGADVNSTCPKTKETALHRAAFSLKKESADHTEAIRILIAAGADVNARTNVNVGSEMEGGLVVQGETPLHFAVAYGERDMIEVLLEAGADKTIATALGETPLDYALKEGRAEGVLELLR